MNIIELAQECQLIGMRPHLDGIYQEALEKFAALVAAREREACAGVFDLERLAKTVRADEREACCAIVYGLCESDNVAQRTVDAIRARGTTT